MPRSVVIESQLPSAINISHFGPIFLQLERDRISDILKSDDNYSRTNCPYNIPLLDNELEITFYENPCRR